MKQSSFLLFTLFLVCAIGCSRGPVCYVVEGTVTFRGEPLTNAAVSFIPVNPDHGTFFANGMTDENGRFMLTAAQFGVPDRGTTAGDYLVTITRKRDEPSRFEQSSLGPVPVFESLIPERYSMQDTSGIQVTVERKRNTFTFDLE